MIHLSKSGAARSKTKLSQKLAGIQPEAAIIDYLAALLLYIMCKPWISKDSNTLLIILEP